jgi:hypothetical protein
MNAGQLRLMVLSAAVAIGCGGMAEAKSHGGHQSGHSSSPSSHGGQSVGGALSRGHHATAISFSTGRHGRSEFTSRAVGFFGRRHGGHAAGRSYASETGHSGGTIQCVTFARADSGIELSGNASSWWSNAEGLYQRGARPEAGSVLNFRANGSMRMGHVAVVNQVVDSRTIEIDHANWGGPGAVRGGISRDISVVDVSPANDWSAVRVALGHSGEYGSIYPTYGFIYNRPDRGTMVAANAASAPVPALNPAPRDLRGGTRDVAYDEVAEAPDSPEPMLSHRSVMEHHRRHSLSVSSRHRSHGRY